MQAQEAAQLGRHRVDFVPAVFPATAGICDMVSGVPEDLCDGSQTRLLIRGLQEQAFLQPQAAGVDREQIDVVVESGDTAEQAFDLGPAQD